jgi:hypothetical protein
MLIQVLLLAAVVLTLVLFVRGRHGVRLQASKRVAFIAFLMLNGYAVLRPDDVSRVANLVGVGRGTDLLLYMLIVAFVFGTLNMYMRLRETERRLTDLARAVAIQHAEQLNRDRGLIHTP